MDTFKAILAKFVRRTLILATVTLLGVVSLFSFSATASYAQIPLNSKATGLTKEELTQQQKDAPLSAEEKVERAYTLSESAGMREEEKLKQEQLDEVTNPQVLDNTQAEEGLIKKAKELIEDVTGQS